MMIRQRRRPGYSVGIGDATQDDASVMNFPTIDTGGVATFAWGGVLLALLVFYVGPRLFKGGGKKRRRRK